MKKLIRILFSMSLFGILISLFAIIIAVATFIENDYGVEAARTLVYRAKWFEMLLLLLSVNLIGSILTNKMYKKGKLSRFLLHISFLIIIIGSAITRYISFEGVMHIREGETSNEILTETTFIEVIVNDGKDRYSAIEKVLFSVFKGNSFDKQFDFARKNISLELIEYIPNAVEIIKNGVIKLVPGQIKGNSGNYDAVILSVSCNDSKEKVTLFGKKGVEGVPEKITVNGLNFTLIYGSKKIRLPFSLKLNDFQLERYPGSNSPSSFASEIILIDKTNNLTLPYKIYMNNVLTYEGYRFFQSSYDEDEKGTILSVNHDYWGTLITYFGYFLLTLSMFMNLFSRKSRIKILFDKITGIREAKKSIGV